MDPAYLPGAANRGTALCIETLVGRPAVWVTSRCAKGRCRSTGRGSSCIGRRWSGRGRRIGRRGSGRGRCIGRRWSGRGRCIGGDGVVGAGVSDGDGVIGAGVSLCPGGGIGMGEGVGEGEGVPERRPKRQS